MPGSAAHALQETASDAGAGLIIVGSTHRGALGRITSGTTAGRVLDRAPCPVAVVPRGWHDEPTSSQRVGVAFVDTEGGRSALRACAAIALCTGAILIAYTVIEPHTHEADRDRAETAVERAIADVAHGLHAEARVLTDGGVEALASETRRLGGALGLTKTGRAMSSAFGESPSTMSPQHPDVERFEALIGTWATEATHPMFDGAVPGSLTLGTICASSTAIGWTA